MHAHAVDSVRDMLLLERLRAASEDRTVPGTVPDPLLADITTLYASNRTSLLPQR